MSILDAGINDAEEKESIQNLNGSSKLNSDAPQFAKDMMNRHNAPDLEVEMQYDSKNPYTMGLDNKFSYESNHDFEGVKEKSSFLDTAKAEFYNFNYTAQGVHAGYEKSLQPNPLDDIAPP